MNIGITGSKEITVTEEMLAVNVGSGDVRVLATPMLIAAIENTAASSVRPYLPEGCTSVGTNVNVTHSAATPCGMKFTVHTELAEISSNGKMLQFIVTARDEGGIISEGTHLRAIVKKQRFEEKTYAKLEAQS